jgi:hypothetical protein
MRRRVLQSTAAVSLFLGLAMLLAWLRSYACSDQVDWSTNRGWRSIRTATGHVQFSLLVADWSDRPAEQLHGPRYERHESRPPFNTLLFLCSSAGDRHIDWSYLGFAWHAKLNFRQGVHHSTTVLPCWFLCAASLSPLILMMSRPK